MREKMFNKIAILATFVLVMFVAFPTIIRAAGSYGASLTASSIYVGGSSSVIITSTNAAGKFNVTSSDSSVATVSTVSTWVDGKMDTAISVKGVKAGTATITVTPVNVSDDEYNLITSPKYLTITVKNKPTNTSTNTTIAKKSSDATLKSIELLNGKIDFNPNVTKYTVHVDKTVTTLGVKAVANHGKAKVDISGDENFIIGTNIVTIKVTAEDGTIKTYEIIVIKSKYGSGPLLSLVVKGYEITPEFDPSRLDYTLEVAGVTSLDVEYEVTTSSSKVEVNGNTNMQLGKNIITVKVTEEDGKETIYTINVTVIKSAEDIEERNELIWKIVIVVLVILVVIETAYIIVKNKKEER